MGTSWIDQVCDFLKQSVVEVVLKDIRRFLVIFVVSSYQIYLSIRNLYRLMEVAYVDSSFKLNFVESPVSTVLARVQLHIVERAYVFRNLKIMKIMMYAILIKVIPPLNGQNELV